MGMLATVMNALAMQNALEQLGVHTRVPVGGRDGPGVRAGDPPPRRAAPRERAHRDFRRGVGSPYFTTDSGAALRAAEMNCDALLKGTASTGSMTTIPRRSQDASVSKP
jgi:uridylate kinase